MPNGDGTGPEGKGPMTGRQRGRCAKNIKSERLGLGLGNGTQPMDGRGRKQGFMKGNC